MLPALVSLEVLDLSYNRLTRRAAAALGAVILKAGPHPAPPRFMTR